MDTLLTNLKPVIAYILAFFSIILNTMDILQAYVAMVIGVLTIIFLVYQIHEKHNQYIDRKNKQNGEQE